MDYNQSYDFHNRSLSFNAYEKDLKNKTVYLVNGKLVKYESFKEVLNNQNVSSIKTINDSLDIVKMNFSYKNVKKIIVATTK